MSSLIAFGGLGRNAQAPGCRASRLPVWSLPAGRELIALTGHQLPLTAIVFSPDENTLISRSADGEVRSWRAATAAQIVARFP